MKVKVLFFANFKELLKCSELDCELSQGSTVSDLCETLTEKGEIWSDIFGQASSSVKIAVNQEMSSLESTLNDDDEVAFFPPVTGG